ncbi:transposase [Zunongwangia sp. F260]|uniref:Transposase n=1 Tax=Autumnicola lenta TaxID=3075593 RepID=A0ABU3CJI2_9FLAO|nr:transposase [Zunongwangia sp. F260]MDT0646509.1 transposase [Zunongwangia sp. F260]
MQGKKNYQEKLFTSFRLSDRIPKENFYRRLKEVLNLEFLYPLTQKFYGESGQKSIDPVVFFKICLVGYLENITTDRGLMNHCAMRLDVLYFLGYDVDEELPWHSTISRTRQLFPEDIFEEVFTKVLKLCIEIGLVTGHTQAIDSAPVKANASMDSLEIKVPAEDLEEHLSKVRVVERVKSRRGRYMKGKRQSTVEPVFGTLKEFLGLRKVNTVGIRQANKCMHLAAIAYNLKKYLKHTAKRVKSRAGQSVLLFPPKNLLQELQSSLLRNLNFVHRQSNP